MRPPSIALIESLGDIGIGTYTYELAEGLTAAGARVDVYGLPSSPLRDWARHHTFRPNVPVVPPGTARASAWLRRRVAPGTLALSLERRGYDWVWTQWPLMMGNTMFWRYAYRIGLPLVHTVHNVVPHERRPDDHERVGPVYQAARALIVHSRHARAELEHAFPSTRDRIIVEPHGAYTCYPPPATDRRTVRARLGIPDGAIVVLAFGWVRPVIQESGIADSSPHRCARGIGRPRGGGPGDRIHRSFARLRRSAGAHASRGSGGGGRRSRAIRPASRTSRRPPIS